MQGVFVCPRGNTHVQEFEREIQVMWDAGAGTTRQEIADHLGLTKTEVKDWINRYNHQQAKLAAGIQSSLEGSLRKSTRLINKEAE